MGDISARSRQTAQAALSVDGPDLVSSPKPSPSTSAPDRRRPMRVPLAGYRSDHRAGLELAQSTRIVQRKERPTSNVDTVARS